MSGLETLPPDQRAVLQLILVQGRGYEDLATTLKLDAAAVRRRAHAGASALGLPGGAGLDAATRGQVVDYLRGQQDDGTRIVTYADLGASPAACRWAQALRERLAGIAREELPEVPVAVAVGVANGSGRSTQVAPATAVQPPAPATTGPASATSGAPTAVVPTSAPATPAPPAPPGDGDASSGSSDGGSSPSRLAGAILIVGIAALAIVLAIVLIGGDDGSGNGSASTGAAQTQASAQRAAARRDTATTPAREAAARVDAQVNLTATADGGSAIGIGIVERLANGRRAIAIQASRLPANGADDIYAVWLQSTAASRFLGFVPRQVRADGSFTVTAPMPANAADFSSVVITREGTTAVPTTPGTAILSGDLRLG